MTETVAVILPPPGGDRGPAERMVAGLAGQQAGRFRVVVLGPPGGNGFAGLEYREVKQPWRLGTAARRYAWVVARVLRGLRPAVIEVHDSLEVAAILGGVFRPVPVVLIVHSDPQGQRGARDAAKRTFQLAQVTRIGAVSPTLRARVLEGVHPSMRLCALLPAAEDATAVGDALDALRVDALEAWSRRLDGPI